MNESKEVRCKVCNQSINLDSDDYVHVKDFLEGKFYTEAYYHNPCWHNALHKKTLDKIQSGVFAKLKDITGNLDISKKNPEIVMQNA